MGVQPPSQVVSAFEGVDLILHAEHVEFASCIEWLERIAPVTATTSCLMGTGEALPRVNTLKVVEAENRSIGMCHELILKSLADDVIAVLDRVERWPIALQATLAAKLGFTNSRKPSAFSISTWMPTTALRWFHTCRRPRGRK